MSSLAAAAVQCNVTMVTLVTLVTSSLAAVSRTERASSIHRAVAGGAALARHPAAPQPGGGFLAGKNVSEEVALLYADI